MEIELKWVIELYIERVVVVCELLSELLSEIE